MKHKMLRTNPFAKTFAFRLLPVLFAVLALAFFLPSRAKAKDLDEIVDYTIAVNINEDATADMVYHIDWKVLDSTSDGPLSWVKIGIPNKHCSDIKALSSNIKDIHYTSNGGTYVEITFDRDYYQDELISFDFSLTQDYMYQMNLLTDGETVYQFTPGWFDEIDVDRLAILWNMENVSSVSPAAVVEDGYYVWESSLPKGSRFKVDITYPNGAYNFSKDKNIAPPKSKFDVFWDEYGVLIVVVAVMFIASAMIYGAYIIASLIGWMSSSGFKQSETKIRRTVIEYYPNCPGCGAPRPEGIKNCEYCGMNFVKSEKIVEEKNVPKKFKDFKDEIFSHNSEGTYAVSGVPNTYIHVASVVVPHRTSFASYLSTQKATSSRGGGGHSSCAHSSCACACACACAGGGRAGCTAKDFYKTNLKMKYFEE